MEKDVEVQTPEEGAGNTSTKEPQTPFQSMEESGASGIALVSMGSSTSKYDEFQEENDLKVFKGHADFDEFGAQNHSHHISNSKWYFGKTKRAAVKVLYLSVFAILGSLLRIIVAQIFGEECKNPGTVGWLKAGQPLCVTANGELAIEGGIIFSDLPANLLGSFIMGLMQSTDTMDLPKYFPIAWLSETNYFQSFDIIHLALTTGFCGSLTTFSSWNSEMVVMMLGADADTGSLIFRAILGYIIGLETALASFVLGKNLAKYIHTRVNEPLHKEHVESKKKREQGVYINTALSDYERRFLSDFDMGEYEIEIDQMISDSLARWRASTRDSRKVGHNMLPLLTDIEYQALVLDEGLTEEMVLPALTAQWDINSLNRWRESKRDLDIEVAFIEPNEFRFAPAIRWSFGIMGLVLFGLFAINVDDAYAVTYKTMLYAAAFAPAGALFRWKLSKWNGKWSRFDWFPLGTFLANIIACMISATAIGIEYRLNGMQNFWVLGTVRAIKIGFAGCLSTVSTFINEFATFLNSDHPVHGYMYAFASLFSSCVLGSVCYLICTYGQDAGVYYYNY